MQESKKTGEKKIINHWILIYAKLSRVGRNPRKWQLCVRPFIFMSRDCQTECGAWGLESVSKLAQKLKVGPTHSPKAHLIWAVTSPTRGYIQWTQTLCFLHWIPLGSVHFFFFLFLYFYFYYMVNVVRCVKNLEEIEGHVKVFLCVCVFDLMCFLEIWVGWHLEILAIGDKVCLSCWHYGMNYAIARKLLYSYLKI